MNTLIPTDFDIRDVPDEVCFLFSLPHTRSSSASLIPYPLLPPSYPLPPSLLPFSSLLPLFVTLLIILTCLKAHLKLHVLVESDLLKVSFRSFLFFFILYFLFFLLSSFSFFFDESSYGTSKTGPSFARRQTFSLRSLLPFVISLLATPY